jgi:hypothetical protein
MKSEPYTPRLGNIGSSTFQLQFRGFLDVRSAASTPIEYFDMDGGILRQHATGFFFRFDNRVFLVSARHAITGLDTFTDACISDKGYLPHKIKVYPFLHQKASMRLDPITLEVRNDNREPLWIEDPDFDRLRTDIACIEAKGLAGYSIACVNAAPDEDLFANVGFDCFIVGYPNQNYHDPYFPIWRRGSLAYEPQHPIDGKPIFLVDAATSPGMSGSAIFQRWHGPAPVHTGPGNGITTKLDSIVSTRFIGVYGGRLSHTSAMAEIGYGWYANRIPIMLKAALARQSDTGAS